MCENPSVFALASVQICENIANDVFKLLVTAICPSPKPGQFFMLRSKPSSALLCRPISVYRSIDLGNGLHEIEFLILKKGKGTKELCSVRNGDELDLLGPVGNIFESPKSGSNIAIIGGGIGVAPVAGFASTLEDKTYDFFASFKTGSYGLEHVNAKNLLVSTDDGSLGEKGMLPIIFNENTIAHKGYNLVYACGPHPMLAYVQKLCADNSIQCYLSLESNMACGVGACLGCTIPTKEGNKRCCKDGPVFDGLNLIL